ncbi:hypothetical protein KP509_01G001600 [Ceratopteris richardii]|uniref:Sec-independent protein translocase protein TatB n=1 Tax=Ceratopteris richardii TaxID=49495 RepID=A0A8T2VA09_CERRI|nr:hypothetical protein KP509_01G001600 [Ceratopteris richardii]
MVFGLSYGEVFLLIAGTVVFLGPKDVPIIARAAGRLTGKAVGYLQTMRGQVDTIMRQSEANNLQKEIRETMAQLDAIRHEVRSGMSIMQPRPFIRENLENHGGGLQQATKFAQRIETTIDRFADATSKNPNAHDEKCLKNSVDLQRQATSYARFAGHLDGITSSASIQGTCVKTTEKVESSTLNESEIPVLPVSAVSMGLFPERKGPIQGGSDLMLETLAEKKVAQQALEFLKQPHEAADT